MNHLKPAGCWWKDSGLLMTVSAPPELRSAEQNRHNTKRRCALFFEHFWSCFHLALCFLNRTTPVSLHTANLCFTVRNCCCCTFNIFLHLLTKKYFNTLTEVQLLHTFDSNLSRVRSEEKQTVRGLLPSFKKSESITFRLRRVAFSGADGGSWDLASFWSLLWAAHVQ